MTQGKRIVFNTIATYGRSVFGMAVGLFSSRWVLMALGRDDLGLYGVVGSVIAFIVILNTILKIAVSRYYAFAIGEAKKLANEDGLRNVREWFNTALFLHFLLGMLLMVVGYPIGMYAIENWLVVPPGRMVACIWVYRCCMLATFIGVISVPYGALFNAYQNIVVATCIGVANSIIHLGCVYILLFVSCDRLILHAALTAGLQSLMIAINIQYARRLFPACRVRLSEMINLNRFRQIFYFSFWELFSCVGNMVRAQGSAIAINRNFGVGVNAALSIASQVSGHAMSLSSAMQGAFIPAVTTAEGAGTRAQMIALSLRCCKFGTLMVLIFAIPLILELEEVLKLWLVNPPEYTAGLCACILMAFIFEKLGMGHHLAISAKGKIAGYHIVVGSTYFAILAAIVLMINQGLGPYSVGYGCLVGFAAITLERVVFARFLVQMSIGIWSRRVVLPLAIVCFCSTFVGVLVVRSMDQSFLRVCWTSLVSGVATASLAYLIVLEKDEKIFVTDAIRRLYAKAA